MKAELQLDAASGYLYLGLPDECMEELEQVEFLSRQSERYMVLKLTALIWKREWSVALVASKMLRCRYPECEMAYTSGAIILIEMARYQEAILLLLQGPVSLRYKAIAHLQMAYCELQMGNDYAADLSLQRARKLNPSLALEAKKWLTKEKLVEPIDVN